MKKLLAVITFGLMTISTATFASYDQSFVSIWKACDVKSQNNACSTESVGQQIDGRCVDAKEYGLLCVKQTK